MNKILLLVLLVFGISLGGEYNRKEWKHWRDLDKDGENTRQEVLIEENLASPDSTKYDEKGRIAQGRWICMFTGDTIYNARELDVDHLVPLKEAHLSGGENWYETQKMLYANFMDHTDHLVAVKASANRSKGAKDPSKWMPDVNKCWYLETWIRVKSNWGLDFDDAEADSITKYKDQYDCGCE